MDGWKQYNVGSAIYDGCMIGNEWMNVRLMDGLMDEWINHGWMDGWMNDRLMDGLIRFIDGWMDGWRNSILLGQCNF